MKRHRIPLFAFAILTLTLGTSGVSAACPFCAAQGQTLSGEVAQADFIVLGKLTNQQRDPNDFTRGTTDVAIDIVVKPHGYLTGKKTIQIPRYVPPDPAGNDKFLIFCSLYTRPTDTAAASLVSSAALADPRLGQLDAYRGEPVVAGSKLAEYLKGAIEVRQKDPSTRLRYFFDYLDSPELVISTDAMNEFGFADYQEVRDLAVKLPAEKVMRWLKDPNTPPSRFGLYGLFIGHCGKKSDAPAIRELLDKPDGAYSSGLDGLLSAYVLLDPKAGWDYVMALVSDTKKEFPVRYAGLKLLRFFWEYRPDVIAHAQVVEAMRILVSQPDLADLPMEDLRKWGVWKETPYVIGFAKQPSHAAIPIVRRAILRFALAAPAEYTEAKAYVEQIRKEDPDRVKFVEQTLLDEVPKPTPPKTGN